MFQDKYVFSQLTAFEFETLNLWSLADSQHIIDWQNPLAWPIRQD